MQPGPGCQPYGCTSVALSVHARACNQPCALRALRRPFHCLQNIPFILYHHLNHEDNRPLLPHLLPRLAAAGQPALRLLRLLCAAFFRPEWYSGRARISSAVGAYSTVYRAVLPPWAGEGGVVLKLVDAPRHIQDRCAQVGSGMAGGRQTACLLLLSAGFTSAVGPVMAQVQAA